MTTSNCCDNIGWGVVETAAKPLSTRWIIHQLRRKARKICNNYCLLWPDKICLWAWKKEKTHLFERENYEGKRILGHGVDYLQKAIGYVGGYLD
jgi:hypothetical protein